MSIYEVPFLLNEKLSEEEKRLQLDTKKEAFKKLVKDKKLPKRRAEVAEAYLLALEPMTSAMLEKWCSKQQRFRHLMRCTITGRTNELANEKIGLLKHEKTDLCKVTGSMAKYYTVVECL